jgi:hypothetical protein
MLETGFSYLDFIKNTLRRNILGLAIASYD